MFTSLSPALLFLAQEAAPEIVRILTVSGLQFLSKEQLEGLHFHVTVIEKHPDLGLQWAELDGIFRLPG